MFPIIETSGEEERFRGARVPPQTMARLPSEPFRWETLLIRFDSNGNAVLALDLTSCVWRLGVVPNHIILAKLMVPSMVCFREGGWVGHSLPNRQQLSWMRKVQQSTPAWLDITMLDEQLRICRGNAGTTFALLKRNDLNLNTFLGV